MLSTTAGTTAAGAIDNLNIANNAAWIHVDAAWAGPLRISQKHGYLLNGVEKAILSLFLATNGFFNLKIPAFCYLRIRRRLIKALV